MFLVSIVHIDSQKSSGTETYGVPFTNSNSFLFLTWINNNKPSNVSENAYSFSNFNGYNVEVWCWTSPTNLMDVIVYLC